MLAPWLITFWWRLRRNTVILNENTVSDECVMGISAGLFKDRDLLTKIQKMHLSPPKWVDWKTNGTIRKCSSRAFQWMVMSVGFDNLKYLREFLCPAFDDRSHHQSLTHSHPAFFWFFTNFQKSIENSIQWISKEEMHQTKEYGF
jgi:hypothetical protein